MVNIILLLIKLKGALTTHQDKNFVKFARGLTHNLFALLYIQLVNTNQNFLELIISEKILNCQLVIEILLLSVSIFVLAYLNKAFVINREEMIYSLTPSVLFGLIIFLL